MSDIAENWRRVSERAAQAAERVGRDRDAVRIIAVSKTQPIERIREVIAAGATDIGESYVQEAAEKMPHIAAVRWHLIGHLQRNKAARAAALFDLIHSVDSVALGKILSQCGVQRGRAVSVLIEVNIGAERSKSGIEPSRARDLLSELGKCEGLSVDGLMAIPPAASSPEMVRPHFRALRELRDQLRTIAPANAPLRELSMGMTDDFEIAIEEGATLVRVGRAIFGERRVRG